MKSFYLLGLVFLVSACSSSEKKSKDLDADIGEAEISRKADTDSNVSADFLKVQDAIKNRNFSLAQNLVERILAKDPKSAEAWFYSGNIFFAQKKWGSAILCYDQSLEHGKETAPLLGNRGLALFASGKSWEAVQDLRRAHDMDRTNVEVAMNLSQLLIKYSNYGGAADVLRRIESSAQDNLLFRSMYGASLLATGKASDSADILGSLVLNSNRATSGDRFNYLAALIHAGRSKDAITYMEKFKAQAMLPVKLIERLERMLNEVNL